MIRKTDTFYAESINQKIQILEFLKDGKLLCRFTRDGHSDEGVVDPKILKSLLNPELYKKI